MLIEPPFPHLPLSWTNHAATVVDPGASANPLVRKAWSRIAPSAIAVSLLHDPGCIARVAYQAGRPVVEVSAGFYIRLRALFLLACKSRAFWGEAVQAECDKSGFRFVERTTVHELVPGLFAAYENLDTLCRVVNEMLERISEDEPPATLSLALTEFALTFLANHELGHIEQEHFRAELELLSGTPPVDLVYHPEAKLDHVIEADADGHAVQFLAHVIVAGLQELVAANRHWRHMTMKLLEKQLSVAAFACCGIFEVLAPTNAPSERHGASSPRALLACGNLAVTAIYFCSRAVVGLQKLSLQETFQKAAGDGVSNGQLLYRRIFGSDAANSGGYAATIYADAEHDADWASALLMNRELSNLREQLGTRGETDAERQERGLPKHQRHGKRKP